MVEILDTTLREGEQTPNVTFTINEKIEIANLLDDFGVDIIEAGHPCVSKDIYKSVKTIANQGYNAEILAHCRSITEDIDIALSCDVSWVGIFFCVSNKRIEQQFRKNIHSVTNQIAETIQYAKDHGLKVRYTPEDTVRTEYETLSQVIKTAINSNVDRISIADTVGAMTPIKMYNFVKKIKNDFDIKLNVHCHNDLGMATANAIAAYEAGIDLIDVTVNGLGERTGITPLSEICPALHSIYKIKNKWKFELLNELTQIVSKYSGLEIAKNTPIVGENAFTHNAGLHVAAVLNDPEFYEIFPAELIGKKRKFILDKMASIHTIKQKLDEIGINPSNENINKILNRVKSLEKGSISDQELIHIFNDNQNEKNMFQ
jgi:2-isopropylmalate synthase